MLLSSSWSERAPLGVGHLYYKACDFDQALEFLEAEIGEALVREDAGVVSHRFALMMRIRAEQLKWDEFENIRSRIQRWLETSDQKSVSGIDYVLGIASLYRGQVDDAETFFSSALERAVELRDRVQALFGLAAVSSQKRSWSLCLIHLEEIEQLIELHPGLSDFEIACLHLRAVCARENSDFESAQALLMQAEEKCHDQQNLYSLVNSFYLMGTVLQAAGQIESALRSYHLCQRLLKEKDLVHLKIQIAHRIQALQKARASQNRIELQRGIQSKVISSEAGEKDCTGQTILLRLLEFLAKRRGTCVSKEEIVRDLWNEEYHPFRHDNKVHVSIRRLRKLIEKSAENPRIILRSDEGYVFNNDFAFEMTEEKK